MKYFHLGQIIEEKPIGILKLNQESCSLIIEICKNLKIPLQGLHLSLWLFHCQVKLLSYNKFDRFVYVCASILVATKIGQHLRNPVDILHQLRNILRRKKNKTFEDSQQLIKKYLKRIFQAQINIMINIGFDFDINLSIQYVDNRLKNQIKNTDLTDKLKQTLTSLYKTQTILYFDYEQIAITAFDILMRNQGINVQLSNFSQELLSKLKNQKIRQIKSFFLNHCVFE